MSNNYKFTLLLVVIFCSCRNIEKQTGTFNKDTALIKYLRTLDSLPYYDTTDLNYKVLKAYKNNDSIFFIELDRKQLREKERSFRYLLQDSCIHLKKLEELGVEQAYRFIYTSPFCGKPIVATATKKGYYFNLHFLIYEPSHDTVPCRIITEFNKKMTSDNWDNFFNKLMFADIWGLKRENGITGLDGSTMTFIGYQTDTTISYIPTKQCYINRWVFSTMREPFDYLLKLSKNKKGCYWIQ